MDGAELRARRKSLGLTQAEFGVRVGLSRDYVGRLELGKDAINPGIAEIVRRQRPAGPEPRKMHDPLEQIIADALCAAGIRFDSDEGGGNPYNLDFYLPDFDMAIEVKRMHTPRSDKQLERLPNIILAQGEVAVRFLAAAIRTGDFFSLAGGKAL